MKTYFLAAACALCVSGTVAAQTAILQNEPPVVLTMHQLERFEVPPETMFNLVLANADQVMPIALINSDVYDFYHNVTIPAGSRLVGKYGGFRSGRHLVEWISLQLPSRTGSLRIDPPLLGTMRDGTTGYVKYEFGAAVGATNEKGFVVPH